MNSKKEILPVTGRRDYGSYLIRSRYCRGGEKTELVFGISPDFKVYPYATWLSDGCDYWDGRYYSTYDEAYTDYVRRIEEFK